MYNPFGVLQLNIWNLMARYMQMVLQLRTLAIAVTNDDNGKGSDNANGNNNSYKKGK